MGWASRQSGNLICSLSITKSGKANACIGHAAYDEGATSHAADPMNESPTAKCPERVLSY